MAAGGLTDGPSRERSRRRRRNPASASCRSLPAVSGRSSTARTACDHRPRRMTASPEARKLRTQSTSPNAASSKRRAPLPAPASTDGEQDVRFAQAAAQEKAYERADPAKDRGGKSLPKVNLRIGIRSHCTLPRHVAASPRKGQHRHLAEA